MEGVTIGKRRDEEEEENHNEDKVAGEKDTEVDKKGDQDDQAGSGDDEKTEIENKVAGEKDTEVDKKGDQHDQAGSGDDEKMEIENKKDGDVEEGDANDCEKETEATKVEEPSTQKKEALVFLLLLLCST